MAGRRYALLVAATLGAGGMVTPSGAYRVRRPNHSPPNSYRRAVSLASTRSAHAHCCDHSEPLEESPLWANGDPESMKQIGRALHFDAHVAPQWTPPTPGAAAVRRAAIGLDEAPLIALPELREDELLRITHGKLADDLRQLNDIDKALVRRSVEAIDYLGNWSCENCIRDSIVLTCARPQVLHGPTCSEYTCAFEDLQPQRRQLHEHIIKRMLNSSRTIRQASKVASQLTSSHSAEAAKSESSAIASAAASVAAAAGGPPRASAITSRDQHVFFVVGVPGSGKDTVLKRYIQSLNLDSLDASADLVKEYLAAWGQDQLSRESGPGKHLLHAQYLHRESILIVDVLVDRALRAGRMRSGQSFGRHITSNQTVTALRKYQSNLEVPSSRLARFSSLPEPEIVVRVQALIADEEKRSVFDG
ncbi:MAG: hypothetical protein SGPRY_004540, partial [Prymnesium sp.]